MKVNKITNELNGLIVLDKPKGITSNTCLSIIKKTIHPKKIGHTGTLDTNATGVLVCLLGDATKSQEYLMKFGKKVYDAELILGIATDTEDITGNIVDAYDGNIESFDNSTIVRSIKSFVGEYYQIPPMYSAKKVNGKKLIDMARDGITIDRKPSLVNIYDIAIKKIYNSFFENKKVVTANILVTCSKGTYIRTLCKDIGLKLGLPSCMGNLRRITNGLFTLESSISLEEIKNRFDNNDYSFIKPCFYTSKETAISFGKFETLHIGHKKIIDNLVSYAKNHNLVSTVMIVGNNSDNEILTESQRISKLKLWGVDNIIKFPLDDINKNISADEFVSNVLVNQLKSKMIITGSDCSFGYKKMGDAEFLKKKCIEYNIACMVLEKEKIPNTDIDISSTFIKSQYKSGNMDLVNSLIGK